MSGSVPQASSSFEPMKKSSTTGSIPNKKEGVTKKAEKKMEPETKKIKEEYRMETESNYGRYEPVNILHIEMLKQKVSYEIQSSEQKLEAKMDKRFAETERKIDNLETKMDLKFVETERKIDSLEAKMDLKFAETDRKIDVLGARVGEMGKTLDKIHFDFRVFLGILGTTLIGGVITGMVKLFMG